MEEVPRHGIHVQTAMGWLLGRLDPEDRTPVPFQYAGAGADHLGGGSANMKLLYAVCGYVAEAEDGRERLLRFYRGETGHGGGEPLTPSHRQLHEGGHAAAACIAHRRRDGEILSLALRWLQVEHALLRACSTKGSAGGKKAALWDQPWTAGARAVQKGKLTGENAASGAFLAAVEGTGPEPPPEDQYFLAALAVAKLPARGRGLIASTPGVWPTIEGGLTIKRWPNGHFFCRFDALRLAGGAARHAGFDGERWIVREGGEERIAAYPATEPELEIYLGPSPMLPREPGRKNP